MSVAVAVLSLLMLTVVTWLAWHAHGIGLLPSAGLLAEFIACACVSVLIVRMCLRPTGQAAWGLLCALLALTGLNVLLHGMSGDRVAFHGLSEQRPLAETVWVPEGFNGEFERLQFLLPGVHCFVPHQDTVDALSQARERPSGAWFIVARPVGAPPLPCEVMQACERVAVRWDIEQRLKPGQVNAGNVARPSERLWRQERLQSMR